MTYFVPVYAIGRIMDPEEFSDKYLEELHLNRNLAPHINLVNCKSNSHFKFRKYYFIRRLEFLLNHVQTKDSAIWDCGCGFGTEAIFLALNGCKVYANTVEFYYDYIPARLKFWKLFGNLDQLIFDYSNIFDLHFDQHFDFIYAKDTLHHIEPIEEGLKILAKALKPGGKFIISEENGSAFPVRLRNFLLRGNKKVIEYKDDKLNKTFFMANENPRDLKGWKKLMEPANLSIKNDSIEYIRIFHPPVYKILKENKIRKSEDIIWEKSKFLRNRFYFGLNFIAEKNRLF